MERRLEETAFGADSNTLSYSFGPFRLFPKRQLLLRHDKPVRIGSRALDILTLLVSRQGEIISKNEFLDICWPGTFVHEANLKVNIVALRRALSDGSPDLYVVNIPGRGYRFVEKVSVNHVDLPSASKPPAYSAKKLPKLPLAIGRSKEISRISAALLKSRCVTVVGSGGVGKTTVAVSLAHNELYNYSDGVAFIDFSTVSDAQYVPAAIAAGVGARQSSEDILMEIVEVLSGKEILLILDNCEHVTSTVSSVINHLLETLPGLKILATSREPVRTNAERVMRLPTLAVPQEKNVTAARALEFSAIQLFVARAAKRAEFVLNDEDAPLVAAICHRLGGIALAIELAASKATALGIPTLLTMLEQRFLLLGNGDRNLPVRQQTLFATLEWSYRLLADDEAELLRVLSVFAGRFQLQDVVAISGAAGFDAMDAIDALERLTNRSIVYTDYRDGTLNYRLLESTRSFAQAKLEDADAREAAMREHAHHVLSMFERSAKEQSWRLKSEWMAEYADRLDDLRNAIAWAFGPSGDRMLGIRLTAAGIPLWTELSSVSEMQSRLERAIIAAQDLGDCPPELVMRLIGARALGMHFAQHLDPVAEAAWVECYRLGVEMGKPEYQLHGLWGLSAYLIYVGRPLEGITKLEQFLGIAEAQSDWAAIAEGHRMLAMAEMYTGKIQAAKRRAERIAKHHQPPTDPVHFARFHSERGVHIMSTFAVVLWTAGDPDRAMRVARAAVERAEVTGHIVSQSNTLAVSAIPVAVWTGDLDRASYYIELLERNGRREDIGIWQHACRFYKSAVRAKRGESGAAFEMKGHLEEQIAAGNYLRAPMLYSMVADAMLVEGFVDEAKDLIAEGRRIAQEHQSVWCWPEVYRIEGLVELQMRQMSKGEELLRLAVEKAVAIEATSMELRASLALAKKLQKEARFVEEMELLSIACKKFDENARFPEILAARSRLRRLTKTATYA
jgi:predicted ATPase/DNA-binding winged helix-turn-helix (wHTH) protein